MHCMSVGEVEALFGLNAYLFERSLGEHSRVYIAIDIRYVKDYILNKITWNLSI